MAADFACKTIDPRNPTGPKVDAIFPGEYTLRLYKCSPVDYENLRAAKYVLEPTERVFFGVREFNEGGWCYTGRPPNGKLRKAWLRLPGQIGFRGLPESEYAGL